LKFNDKHDNKRIKAVPIKLSIYLSLILSIIILAAAAFENVYFFNISSTFVAIIFYYLTKEIVLLIKSYIYTYIFLISVAIIGSFLVEREFIYILFALVGNMVITMAILFIMNLLEDRKS